MERYDPKEIERKWRARWLEEKVFAARDDSPKPKYYALVEFPYPSGDGLHTGHVRSYTAMDIVARKRRMEGYNVLYPIGWDAFGLPTENYAIKTGIHPKIVTKKNTDTFRRQLQSLGFSFDWDREVNTTDPGYYRWTQWIFLQFYKKGLAYKEKMPINWCPSCKIGLANEEVVSGKCERCGTPVERREKEQWMLAITKYADRLLADLDTVEYLEKIKTQQVNWIGKSEGAELGFAVADADGVPPLIVFTTRPDTLFGATYMVVAPEHPLVHRLEDRITNLGEVAEYMKKAAAKTEEERLAEGREKTGVEIKGIKAVNPATKEEIPVFVADYVLGSYGTGAIMAVPAHDERDFAFAKKFALPIRQVVARHSAEAHPAGADLPYTGGGILMNSGPFDGMDSEAAKREIVKAVGGRAKTQFHLRDWVFSRQHYWGEPIPVVFCEKDGMVPVPEKDLPVMLPDIEKYQPTDTGESPLSAIREWVNVACPACGGPARRETDTMPNWAGSSWYFLRYTDPKNDKAFAAPEKLKHWMQVDWYNGGMEHTTLHLLYSRFWNKFLYDLGAVPVSEPYMKRTSQGMVLGKGGDKMSKSKGNVVNPDSVVENFGADTLRVYEMFMGPFDQAIPWDDKSIQGAGRFLERFWNYALGLIEATKEEKERYEARAQQPKRAALHRTIKKVGDDIEAMKFNTAISAMMSLLNELTASEGDGHAAALPDEDLRALIKILGPFAPHMAQELWSRMGGATYLDFEPWPVYDPKLAVEDETTLVFQVDGRVRDTVRAARGIGEEEARAMALANEKVRAALAGREPKRVIFVKDRLVNVVA